MKDTATMTSAAVYFDRTERHSIPIRWFERAFAVFAEYNLSPILFTASGGDFLFDDCYVLAERGHDISLWGEVFAARRDDLMDALRADIIEDVGLDVPRADASSRSDWSMSISISLVSGIFHFGLDEQFIPDPTILLRRAYSIVGDFFSIRYGIAYKLPLSREPDCYASGSGPFTFSEFQEWLRSRHAGTYQKTPDELWSDELSGERRHLTGLFRGAYPANLLSDAHVQSAALRSRGVGKLTELDKSLWLWELTDAEIPEAEKILESRGVLVGQVPAD